MAMKDEERSNLCREGQNWNTNPRSVSEIVPLLLPHLPFRVSLDWGKFSTSHAKVEPRERCRYANYKSSTGRFERNGLPGILKEKVKG